MSAPGKTLDERKVAGMREAIACRLFHNYQSARSAAQLAGADVTSLPDGDADAIMQRYRRLVEGGIFDDPGSASAVRAYIDFAAIVLLDQQAGDFLDCGTMDYREIEREHAIRALAATHTYLNKMDIAEMRAREAGGAVIPQPDGSVGVYVRRDRKESGS